MTDAEQLSRLLDDDLPPEEAAALRARIDAEPHLARAWQRMQALPGQLSRLPSPPVPAHLLHQAPPAPARRAAWGAWLAAAVAAAVALLAIGTRPTPPTLHLQSGAQLVEGDVLLQAGPARVAVDGRARITVEPTGGPARGVGAEEDPMSTRTAALGAAAGALVTITVYEGRARLLPGDEAAPVEVPQGETHSVALGAPAAPAVPDPVSRTETPAAAVARLEAEAAALRTENEALRIEAAVAQGQLEAWRGRPAAFPEDTPRALSPEGFGAHMSAALEGIPDADLLEVDCSEMPCLAVIRSTSTAEDWTSGLDALHADDADWGTDTPVNVAAMASELDDDEDGAPPVRLYLVGAWPDDPEGPDVRDRLHTRSQDLLQGVGEGLMDEQAGR